MPNLATTSQKTRSTATDIATPVKTAATRWARAGAGPQQEFTNAYVMPAFLEWVDFPMDALVSEQLDLVFDFRQCHRLQC